LTGSPFADKGPLAPVLTCKPAPGSRRKPGSKSRSLQRHDAVYRLADDLENALERVLYEQLLKGEPHLGGINNSELRARKRQHRVRNNFRQQWERTVVVAVVVELLLSGQAQAERGPCGPPERESFPRQVAKGRGSSRGMTAAAGCHGVAVTCGPGSGVTSNRAVGRAADEAFTFLNVWFAGPAFDGRGKRGAALKPSAARRAPLRAGGELGHASAARGVRDGSPQGGRDLGLGSRQPVSRPAGKRPKAKETCEGACMEGRLEQASWSGGRAPGSSPCP
jgi:hypothetical protein